MIAYQVRHGKVRKIKVLGRTATGFRTATAVALWPSGRNTFSRQRDAIAYLASQTRGNIAAVTVAPSTPSNSAQ